MLLVPGQSGRAAGIQGDISLLPGSALALSAASLLCPVVFGLADSSWACGMVVEFSSSEFPHLSVCVCVRGVCADTCVLRIQNRGVLESSHTVGAK